MAWNYTSFHEDSCAVIKYNHDSNEVVVIPNNVKGLHTGGFGLSTILTTTAISTATTMSTTIMVVSSE